MGSCARYSATRGWPNGTSTLRNSWAVLSLGTCSERLQVFALFLLPEARDLEPMERMSFTRFWRVCAVRFHPGWESGHLGIESLQRVILPMLQITRPGNLPQVVLLQIRSGGFWAFPGLAELPGNLTQAAQDGQHSSGLQALARAFAPARQRHRDIFLGPAVPEWPIASVSTLMPTCRFKFSTNRLKVPDLHAHVLSLRRLVFQQPAA